MEPVGLAASVLTLASAVLQVSTVIRDLKKNYSECPGALTNLSTAVSELQHLIDFVQGLDEQRLRDNGGFDSKLFEDCKSLVEKCTRDLSNIQQKLQRLGPGTEKGFRAKLKKAVQRMDHERELVNLWNQVLHYTQHFTALLTRIGANDNRIYSNNRIGVFEAATVAQFGEVVLQLGNIQASATNMPMMHSDLHSQRAILDLLVGTQLEDSRRIHDVRQQVSQHILDVAQYQQNTISQLSILQSRLEDVEGSLVQTADLSRQDRDTSNKILRALQKLQLDMDATKQSNFDAGNTEPVTTRQISSSSSVEFQMDSRCTASFVRLLELGRQSLATISSGSLRAVMRDLVTVLDCMKAVMNTDFFRHDMVRNSADADDLEHSRSIFYLTQRLELTRPKGQDPTAIDLFFESSLNLYTNLRHIESTDDHPRVDDAKNIGQSSSLMKLSHVAISSKSGRLTTKFGTFQTPMGRLNVLLKRSQFSKQDYNMCDGDSSENRSFARVSLFPAADLPWKTEIVFQCENLQYLGETILKPAELSFRAIRSNDSLVFEVAKYGSPEEMAMLFANKEASITDCDSFGCSLLSYALFMSNVDMVRYLIGAGADVDSFEPLRAFCNFPEKSVYAPVSEQVDISSRKNTVGRSSLESDCLNELWRAGADISVQGQIGFPSVVDTLLTGSLQVMKAMLDHADLYITPNSLPGQRETPLGNLMDFGLYCSDVFQVSSKVALLLSRGANPGVRDLHGDTYLHRICRSSRQRKCTVYENLVTKRRHGELKDILMLLITAGADVFAVNYDGQSASEIALAYGLTLEWREALEECGYDDVGKRVFDQEERLDSAPDPRKEESQPHRLSFADYLEIRKSRLLNLNVEEDESPKDAYRRYYMTSVPQDQRIYDYDDGYDSLSDHDESEIEDGENYIEEDDKKREEDFDDDAGSSYTGDDDSNSDAKSFDTAFELLLETG